MSGGREIVLHTSQLSVGYPSGGTVLLENLHLQLREGELICFMGPNGSGKSTLIRTLAGFQKPVTGGVTFVSQHRSHAEQVAVVLTDKISAVNMTVQELITFGRYPYLNWDIQLREVDRRIIEESIDLVHIRPLVNRKLYQLSDGQLQMAMIARALAQETSIILLDEPTAHLDLNNRIEIMRLLRNLARKTGKAILVATHELDLALQAADLIWLTGKNKNIITGIPEDLVLDGTFDTVFAFKGFDLKTGKVKQEPYRNRSIQFRGDGSAYLWTKNALERNGFEVRPDEGDFSVTLRYENDTTSWVSGDRHFTKISELITYLT